MIFYFNNKQRRWLSRKRWQSEACKRFSSSRNSRSGSTASHGGCRKRRRKPLLLLRVLREIEEASVVGEEEGIEEAVDVVAQKQEMRAIRPLQRPTAEEVHTDRIQKQGGAVLPALGVEAGALEEVAHDD